MQKSIAILCAGGPAPGINTVISTISKVFLKDGYRIIGIHDGYKNLFNGKADTVDINFHYADRIFPRGGSTLRMSRYKPKDDEFSADFFLDNNVKLLVTIGGDDTASSSNRLAKFLAKKKVEIQNIHVPKTIDNDIPLPDGMPTFGFNSAKDAGVAIGNIIYEDSRTSGNWFVIASMGRSAGHLAFEIGASCHFPIIIIPEMFNKTRITLSKVIDLIVSSMVKRMVEGIGYGVAIVSEGIFHVLDDEDIKNCGITFTYDAHGHPELGNVSKAHIINVLVQRKLKELDIQINSRPVEMGYELRCHRPVAYDLTLCTILGMGVKKLFDQGHKGCIVSTTRTAEIKPIFLKDIEDKDGIIQPRLVNINSEFSQLVLSDMHVLTEPDYKKAKKWVSIPETYDFYRILNWDPSDAMLRAEPVKE
ncbi:MAG: 6-phosphofructokinase [Lewinellaceae bacterium]|nr:6-phosphofructokinase [Phaeodactylibacter sp.]MCB9036610.1 6-phosphofructokinase [Lewinellaceae bacterium]